MDLANRLASDGITLFTNNTLGHISVFQSAVITAAVADAPEVLATPYDDDDDVDISITFQQCHHRKSSGVI